MKTIGDAVVHVSHDRFYDKYHWGLTCFDQSSELFPPMGVLISVEEVATCGVSFIFSESLEDGTEERKLEYRFDDGDSIVVDYKLSALNHRHAIVEFDQKEFSVFLDNFASATELTFSVGDREDTLLLTEMNKAVEKFRELLSESYIVEIESSDKEKSNEKSSDDPESEEQNHPDQ